MSDSLQFQLRATWLPALGAILGAHSPLSLFPAAGDWDEARDELVRAGFVDAAHNLTEPYARALMSLARPTRVARMRLRSSVGFVEYRTHFGPGPGPPVSATTVSGTVDVRVPAAPDDVGGLLGRHQRVADGRRLHLALTLPRPQASAAVALIDGLQEESGGVALPESTFLALPEIRSRLSPGAGRGGRLPGALAELWVDGAPVSEAELERALVELEQLGLAARADGGWCPAGALLAIAKATWPVGGSVAWDVMTLDGGRGSVLDAGVVVHGDEGGLLLMRAEGASVRIEGIGPSGLDEMLRSLLMTAVPPLSARIRTPVQQAQNPMPSPAPRPTPPADPGEGPSTIPRLNLAALRASEAADQAASERVTGLQPGPGCRVPLHFCGGCGSRVREGSLFCVKCGVAVPH